MLIMAATSFALAGAGAQGLGAHVHGEGDLAVAVEASGRLIAEIQSPGDSFFGFEGEPRNAQQRRAVEQARTVLMNGAGLLRFNGEADCRFQGAEITEDGHGGHSDIRVAYQFQCARPDRISRLETALFDAFPRLHEMHGIYLSPRGQDAFELTPSSPGRRLPR